MIIKEYLCCFQTIFKIDSHLSQIYSEKLRLTTERHISKPNDAIFRDEVNREIEKMLNHAYSLRSSAFQNIERKKDNVVENSIAQNIKNLT